MLTRSRTLSCLIHSILFKRVFKKLKLLRKFYLAIGQLLRRWDVLNIVIEAFGSRSKTDEWETPFVVGSKTLAVLG